MVTETNGKLVARLRAENNTRAHVVDHSRDPKIGVEIPGDMSCNKMLIPIESLLFGRCVRVFLSSYLTS